ncbi:MAG: NADH-quinone oxidoreductase subunit N [Acidobacteriaceae bacterium]
MNMTHFSQVLQLLGPEIIVVLTALAVMAADLFFFRKSQSRTRFLATATIGAIGCGVAIGAIVLYGAQGALPDGLFLSNPLIRLVQVALLVITILTLFLATDSDFTEHVGEFVLLVLLATTGMMFLVASQDLLVIFISLELLSLSVYILAGFDKRSPRSSEAALKYFLFGGMSAAFMLFGFSLLYGFAHSTNLLQIADAIHVSPLNPLVILAIVTTVIGFGFKVAAAPFHFWAPDVYQGAPNPSAAFIASGSKVASFFIFFQVLALGFAGAEGIPSWHHFQSGWVPVLVLVSVFSMLLGNLVAITQNSIRRLLAYSAVAHAGYMLLAFVAHSEQSLAALIYYVATYSLATLGIFGILTVTEREAGNDTIAGLAGLSRRAPFLAGCLFIFILSLAGIPPLSGFFAKFLLFTSVLAVSPESKLLIWLIIFAIGMSAVSLFYYLRVLKSAFVADPGNEATKIESPLLHRLVVGLLAGGVIILGCAPDVILNQILRAVHASGL